MEKVIINLRKRSYPIIIDSGLFKNTVLDWPIKRNDTAVFVTSERIAPMYLSMLNSVLIQSGIITDSLVLPDGERYKSLNMLDRIFTKLLTENHDRNTVLIALGGGVIGDLTGFAAATYQRGIRFIQIPTTLLAQVDASIGGKTGINHVLGKNMIGAFYQPVSVFIDLDFLKTLTVREFSSGLAEIIKYALAFDADFFSWLENNLDNLLLLESQALAYCIRRCCEIKSFIVSLDEYEYSNRSLLNLGHTYGHAIESYLQYKTWSHGEAVAAGMMISIHTALCLGVFSGMEDCIRVRLLLKKAKLPVRGPSFMKPQSYIEYMLRDKKSRLGQINLVLPISIGKARMFMNVNQSLIINSIKDSYEYLEN